MKDQIIHTLVISLAILGAGFVIGTIVKDKPQVVAGAKPEVVINNNDELLKELVVANERLKNEVARQSEETSEAKRKLSTASSASRRSMSQYNRALNEAKRLKSEIERLEMYENLFVSNVITLNNASGVNYNSRNRVYELEKENKKLLENYRNNPSLPRIILQSDEDKANALLPKDKIKYFENKTLIAALWMTVSEENFKIFMKTPRPLDKVGREILMEMRKRKGWGSSPGVSGGQYPIGGGVPMMPGVGIPPMPGMGRKK